MSYFFDPSGSQFINYCVFIPVLPYIYQFQESNSPNINSSNIRCEIKNQQIDRMTIKTLGSLIETEKQVNSNSGQFNQQNQNSISFVVKNSDVEQKSQIISSSKKTNVKGSSKDSKISLGIKNDNEDFGKLTKPIKNKNNKQKLQDEYHPFQKRKKSEPTFKENQNRNIIPNQINQIFSYIQKSNKSIYVVNRIFAKYPPPNPNYNTKRFYLYQSLLKGKVSNYINESSLSLVTQLYEPRCQVYCENEQRYYNKICRVLIQHFLQQDSIFNILTSRRMYKEKKRSHLRMRRVLRQKVAQILRH